MSDCAHEDFAAFVDVNRLSNAEGGPINGFSADVRVDCTQCGEAFTFHGVPVGLSPAHPTMSVNGRELHVPLRPESSDPAFGLGLLGFAMRIEQGNVGQGSN